MARKTYSARALVLKRTKLGETDLICTMLSVDGSQIRAIAKGGRKPSSPFTSRLELFSTCDLLLAKGKSLDIIKEARLVEGNAALRCELTLTEAASPMVELIEKASLDSLENDKLFPLTFKALHTLAELNPTSSAVLSITIAHLLKAVSFLGFKPELRECLGCGRNISTFQEHGSGSIAFSFLEGGIICPKCVSQFETRMVDREVIKWADVLLYSTFEQIEVLFIDEALRFALLRFLQTWIKIHVGYSLRSLNYIFSYGLPS